MLNLVPEIVDVTQFQRWNRSEQPTKLPCRVRAQLKFVPQAKFFRPAAHQQADAKVLDPAAETVRSTRSVTVTFLPPRRCVQR